MKTKQHLILDTSLFVNPASAQSYGANPTAALTQFLTLAKKVESVEFLMPPSIYKELMFFAEEAAIPKQLLVLLKQKPPLKYETKVPGIFIYTLVEEIRERVDRGLRLAERHVREALQSTTSKETVPASRHVRPDADAISRLRESYRRIMREGMLDSKADADLLLLAYELNGTLVSADQGVLDWAEKLGIALLPYDQLPVFLAREASAQDF